MRYLGKGLALFEDQVVYMEMQDYRGPPLELTPEQEQQMKGRQNRARFLTLSMDGMETRYYRKAGMGQIYEHGGSDEPEGDDEPVEMVRPPDPKLRALIRNFFKAFQGTNMWKSVYGLEMAGMVDHTEGKHKGHCSILYKLPGTIGVQSYERPAENLKLRAPMSLLTLLGTKQNPGIRSTLGARFELARKLVRSVCLLHSSGWLHQNIRAESVIFFPEHVGALQENRYEINIEIDVSEPILMGYIFSRPDDILQMNPSSAPQTEEYNGNPPKKSEITAVWDHRMDERARWSSRKVNPRADGIYGRNILGKLDVLEHMKVINISGFTLDYYQHPAKHADPKRLYRHAYDVYSLGILLLEVGLWEKLSNYEDSGWGRKRIPYYSDHYEQRRWICREYLDRLRWACGDTYANVVLNCLMIESSDSEVAKASEMELCVGIVADLEGCRA